ncbi:MAG: ABC transporter ATP-binding protein [Clostridiales bacterium]|nr:ABC transporter ATP-binding protein [Clostridiales bacterium]
MEVVMRGLTKHFGPTVAVDDFSVTLGDGELVCLLGPSGCGKSTVLNMLAGIIPVTAGSILFDGEDVTRLPPEQRGIGLVFQNYALYPHMTVMGNITFPLEIQKVPPREREERARGMADLVHMSGLLSRKPKELSGGQQQRVAIARALVKRPRLLLLDEPLSNLDARLRLEMREEIRRIQQETKVTTVFVTHDQEEAMSISDHIVLMKEGRLQQHDRPQQLYNQPVNQFVADFLGNPPINNFPGEARGGFFVAPDGARVRLREGCAPPEGARVNLSVRAESFTLEDGPDEGRMASLVESVYQTGKEEMALLRFGGTEFRAYLSADYGLKPGDAVHLGLKDRGVFLFDRATGERYC